MGSIKNIRTLVQTMAWRWIDDKLISEPMVDQVSDEYMRRAALVS